jgi:hypothetical protein
MTVHLVGLGIYPGNRENGADKYSLIAISKYGKFHTSVLIPASMILLVDL